MNKESGGDGIPAELVQTLKYDYAIVAPLVKNPPAMQETWVQSLGWEDTLEKGMATHSSILAWRFHGLYSPRGHKESDMSEKIFFTPKTGSPWNV